MRKIPMTMSCAGVSDQRKNTNLRVFALSILLSAVVFALDLVAPPRNVWTLYVLPLLAIAGMRGYLYPLALACFCTVLTLAGLHLSPGGISWDANLLDRFFGMGAGWIFVMITIQRNQAVDRLAAQKHRLEKEVERRRIEEAERARTEEALRKEGEERKKIEEQLRQAQKMESLGTLAGGIAHDFNNILAVILGNAELGLEDLELDQSESLAESLHRIVKASGRGKDLVKQILAFTRKTPQKRESIHLIPVLTETCSFLRASLPANIAIEFDVESENDEIVTDPSQMQQVLMNLATNAVDAMQQKGGVLHIGLADIALSDNDMLPDQDMCPGSYLRLRVRDTGGGMTAHVRKRLFEPFFTTKEVGKGTGLGLSVVYGIVKGQGGGITVESRRGKGTCFNIFLPKTTPSLSKDGESEEGNYRGSGRILFIDDEADLAYSMRLILEHLGYCVTMITDPIEALQAFRTGSGEFDLVITDQTMPNMTGTALAKKMLKIRQDTPIILCTGYNETVSEEQAKATGVREFLVKPVSRKELAETVLRVMNSKG